MWFPKRVYRKINSINQRLLLLFIIVTTVPILLLGSINLVATTLLLDGEVTTRQQEVMQLIADQINFYVEDVEHHLLEAGLVWFNLKLSPEDMVVYLQTVLEDLPHNVVFWITDASGQEMVRVENGELVPSDQLKNLSEQEVFFRPERGEHYFSAIRIVDNEPRLTVALPLIENGKLEGTVGGQMNLNTPWQVIRDTTIGLEGYAMLMDRQGNVMVHRDNRVMDQRLNLANLPPVSKIATGTTISTTLHYYSPVGGRVIGSAIRIEDPDWVLVVERPESDAFAPIQQSFRRLIIGGGISLLIAVIMSIFFSRQITLPIIRLRNAANRIRFGDLEHTIPDHNRTEIGELARAFNAMTVSLNERIQEVNQKNQALMQATIQTREASRLKDEFLAVISHELRTPLHAIIGYTGIVLMDGEISLEGVEMLERVESNSQRLLALINDLLDISRLEAKKIRLFPAEILIRQLAQGWYDQMRVLALDKGLDFKLQIDDQVPEIIISDESGLTKVASNLLSNAIKFTAHGSVHLTLGCENDGLKIVVQDTGIGIPAMMHEAIFDRFRQVDGSSTRAYGGTGLGLAIVRSMCEAMQGNVKLESSQGQGSTFTVWLPLPLQVAPNQDTLANE
ncbi:MAG TPA: sensor histidine kinase [Phototrophicaceae bacterium]|nr:sensor histidine kinase [Phototrophicaceae bacterium]